MNRKECTSDTTTQMVDIIERAHLEIFGATAGVKLLGVVEGAPKFNYVEFPADWKKILPDNVWQEKFVVDDKGRKRATIHVIYVGDGYKCRVWPLNRFQVSHTYNPDDDVVVGHVYDGGKLIHTTDPIKAPSPIALGAEAAAAAWLDQNYPDWRKYGAYWD